MPGIRIQHPTKRSTSFTLTSSRPLREPLSECPACHLTHALKTYHFRLDEVGAAIVSFEIVERLKQIPGQPFSIGEEIAHPPAQRIEMPVGGRSA